MTLSESLIQGKPTSGIYQEESKHALAEDRIVKDDTSYRATPDIPAYLVDCIELYDGPSWIIKDHHETVIIKLRKVRHYALPTCIIPRPASTCLGIKTPMLGNTLFRIAIL